MRSSRQRRPGSPACRRTCEQEAQLTVCCWCRSSSSRWLTLENHSWGGCVALAYLGPPPPCLLSHFRKAVTPLHRTSML